jgi:hypothetical protein
MMRQTVDGFEVDGTTPSGVPVRLTVSGFTDDPTPLVIECTCRRCGVHVSRREYEVGDPMTPSSVNMDAVYDAMRAVVHSCGERS